MNEFWTQAISTHNHRLIVSLLAAGLRLDEARDVAQEAWLRLMEASADGRLQRVELPGLVIRQAAFIVADRERSRGRRRLHEGEANTAAGPELADSPALAQEILSLVDKELSVAPARARRVFWASLAEPDAPHRVLAEREGLSLQRFRQVLCETRARLRRVLMP